MPLISIDGNSYDTDQLSEAAKAQITNLQFVEAELQRLNAKIAVFNTAKAMYRQALIGELNTTTAA